MNWIENSTEDKMLLYSIAESIIHFGENPENEELVFRIRKCVLELWDSAVNASLYEINFNLEKNPKEPYEPTLEEKITMHASDMYDINMSILKDMINAGWNLEDCL